MMACKDKTQKIVEVEHDGENAGSDCENMSTISNSHLDQMLYDIQLEEVDPDEDVLQEFQQSTQRNEHFEEVELLEKSFGELEVDNEGSDQSEKSTDSRRLGRY